MKPSKSELLASLKAAGITDESVITAIQSIPREQFVQKNEHDRAYENSALGIDCNQTISQPYIIGLMTQAVLGQNKRDKVLEIGTGSGYQTAILAKLFNQVFTLERHALLTNQAKNRLDSLNLSNVHYFLKDGFEGLSEHAPFDAIVVTAAPVAVPPMLTAQLSNQHGTLVIPIGDERGQTLEKIVRTDTYQQSTLEYVQFVPMLEGVNP